MQHQLDHTNLIGNPARRFGIMCIKNIFVGGKGEADETLSQLHGAPRPLLLFKLRHPCERKIKERLASLSQASAFEYKVSFLKSV